MTTRTIGRLCEGDEFLMFTCEDRVRPVGEPKVPGETAIPTGTYKVVLDYSNRFKKGMPHVLDVPGFTGIRIHPGNTEADTEGCILVGMSKSVDGVHDSRHAFEMLMRRLKLGFFRGDVTLTVTNG